MAATKGMSVFEYQGEEYSINDPNNANEFSTGSAYGIGDTVTYQGDLYMFIKAHSAGSFNSAECQKITVGSELKRVKDYSPVFYTQSQMEEYGFNDLDDIDINSVHFVSYDQGEPTMEGFPFDAPGWVQTAVVPNNKAFRYQTAICWDKDKDIHIKYRVRKNNSTGYGRWFTVLDAEDFYPLNLINIPKDDHSSGNVDFVWNETHKGWDVTGTSSAVGWYSIIESSNSFPQGISAGESLNFSYDGINTVIKIYSIKGGNYTELTNGEKSGTVRIPSDAEGLSVRLWFASGEIINETVHVALFNPRNFFESLNSVIIADNTEWISCNDVDKTCTVFVGSSGGQTQLTNFPYDGAGYLITYCVNANIKLQYALPYSEHLGTMKFRCRTIADGWQSWVSVGGGGSTTTIIQEVSRDTYNNSYDITVSPEITTDSNGWLQPVDTESADETGKTDMTSAIMAMLNSTGYCHLAPGIYYVSGSIDMPADSMIEGCGKQTIVRLLQSVSSGYIVRMHTRSTVRNLTFSGGYGAMSISDSNIGGRKGINYIGNRDGQSSGVTPATCTCCMIEGCWFENLDSGFYGYNAGGGLQEGVICNNCYFTRCKAGINIDYWTEYCKFTNCITFQCYFACINNGGNNVFTACTFHGVIGFVIDNSTGTKENCAHGTVNGCTFNHIDNMNHPETLGNGYGIKVIDAEAGFVFANCQFWYGKVYVESSKGVQISNSEFGGNPTIETSGNDTVFFTGCIFQIAPTKLISSPTKFDNCYTYGGSAVTD